MNLLSLFRNDDETVLLQPGAVLFHAGDAADDMYVLLEGEAEIRVGDRVVETSQPGALVGEMALIEDGARTADVVAKTVCRFARVSRKRFTFLVQQTPFFSLHVMKVLVHRLKGMNEIVAG